MRPIDEAKLIIEYMNDEIYGLEYSDYDKYCAAEHIASVLEKRDARIAKLEAALKWYANDFKPEEFGMVAREALK